MQRLWIAQSSIKGLLAELARSGLSTRRIAQELTARGNSNSAGGRWHPQTVKRVMERVVTVGNLCILKSRLVVSGRMGRFDTEWFNVLPEFFFR